METKKLFQGFEIRPIRDAHLITSTTELHIQNVNSSGLNVVPIDLSEVTDYKVCFNEIPGFLTTGSVLKTAIFSKDSRGLIGG